MVRKSADHHTDHKGNLPRKLGFFVSVIVLSIGDFHQHACQQRFLQIYIGVYTGIMGNKMEDDEAA